MTFDEWNKTTLPQSNDCTVEDEMRRAWDASAAVMRERIARVFDVPARISGEAEDWSRAAAAKIRAL